MGVQGLWTVVQPCARPTNLSTLNRKRLAIDASIWIYQFLKAVRDKEGNALRNSHVVGFFRRICKLLWYGVKPVFVFDGGAPALKRATLQARRRRREGRQEDAARTAGKLLAVQMQRIAEEEEEKRRRRAEAASGVAAREAEEEQEQLPSMDQIVYADELGMSKQERQKARRFHKQDAYHLPELENGIEAMGKPNDPRIMSIEELEEYARQFNNGEDINLYDFSKIDFDGEFFKSLPPADRYNILNAARIRSRLRMGLSKEQLDTMFPDRMAFSRFQIERVKERNHLTQRLMHEMGMAGTDLTLGVNRIAGDRNREYILVKNEGAEGGWALGVVSKEKDRGQAHKPIDVDALEFQYQGRADEEDEDEWEDEEFEDVPIEGLNRLPKPKDHAEESLFVDNGMGSNLFGEDDALEADEEEDLNRAIALSLQNQHNVKEHQDEDENEEFEDVPAPEWTQKAVEAPRPIPSTSGRTVAHIVNNRASAAVPKRRDSESSDSDVDFQAALAAARKKQPRAQPVPAPAPLKPNAKNPFEGPLPFEKLDWRAAFSGKSTAAAAEKPKQPQEAETGDLEAVSDDEAGGFEREPSASESIPAKKDDKPRPLPPWLTDDTDIRESVRKQQEWERQMNTEAEETDGLRFRHSQDDDVIEIESSSDEGSDIEILDAPPPAKQPVTETPGASLPSLKDGVAKESVEVLDSTGHAVVTDTLVDIPADGERPQKPQEDKSMETAAAESEDEEMEFEDVVLPTEPEQIVDAAADAIRGSEEAQIEAELFGESTPPPAQQTRIEGLAPARESSPIDPDAPGPEEFDDFSDPEEEELLAQMAEEAEEHARFASQLNNKSQRENQEAYEQELRALRAQQKKDRRDADEVTQVMITECQALLRLFGIPYITAPMEAEAQCAELVRLNLVDGIVTDDSDIFLFGGTRVYKNVFNSNKYVECYLATDLETELSLSREQLISLAQLLGSDYAEGLPGVGPVTALEILSEFPGRDGLAEFRDWWQDVQNRGRPKDADAASPFRRKFRKAHATKLFLPPGFPSPAVAEAYLHPEVDSSPEPFQWGVPDLDGLRRFLVDTIGWDQERTDEVLVPVIRDMNRREVEGTQSNITRFFAGAVGSGAKEAFAPRQRAAGGSKRMADAVSRLRAKTGGGGGGGGGSDGALAGMPVAAPPAPKAGRKRKGRGAAAVENGDEDEDGGGEEAASEVEDDAGGGNGKGKRKRNARAAGRGKKSKA
ncbi:c1063de6-9e5b-4d7e-8350-d8d5d2c4cb60 [Thermothielavioides terrestris]|uniref:C1063de6-9e5b-4d7e-8350-d8d5d2c4cb60 n=1 Tax=Thermothielavioides terrestris TaxID=2587410 RepID=A0A446B7Z4_9PEZI|nr:c1063de6-9e5b-4d7e-8350-d8d5d2c4cb60 [Thermothielavioides terrestris]